MDYFPTWLKKPKNFFYFIVAALAVQACNKGSEFSVPLLDIASPPAKAPVTGLTDKQLLGKYIYFDNSLSANAQFPNGGASTQACASCHLPDQGFAGLANINNGIWQGVPFTFKSGIGQGAVVGAFGGRKPPSAAYATFSPILTLGTGEMTGEFLGGLFWDGRATGFELANTAAEQARGPFLADKEHNFNTVTGRKDLLLMIKKGSYYPLYKKVWGAEMDLITAATSPSDPLVIKHYNNIAFSIADYEASSEVNQFSSKYDNVIKKKDRFTPLEQEGYNLMGAKGAGCGAAGCHAEKNAKGQALWTDFGYDNLGLPWKSEYLFEEGLSKGTPDPGLYTTINDPNFPANLKKDVPLDHFGTFKTPTLRNVAKGFANKRFMHNGIFRTLEEVVHFYNTRDVPGAGWNPNTNKDDKNVAGGWRPWGSPEYAATMAGGGEVGRIGLTDAQETAIVAFMHTLNDTRPILPPPPYSTLNQ